MSRDVRIADLDATAEKIMRKKTAGMPFGEEMISDYRLWREEALDLFDEHLGRQDLRVVSFLKHDHDWTDTNQLIQRNFAYQYPIFKVLIRKIKDLEAPKPVANAPIDQVNTTSAIKVFISHASQDVPIVRAFRDDILMNALGLRPNDIFCTTLDGTKIESGEDWRKSIRAVVRAAKIHFLIITPHYKESEVCQNEMGGAWISDGQVIPLIIDPITYGTVGVIQQPNQIEKVGDTKGLDRVRDQVVKHLGLDASKIKSDHWTAKKEEFLAKLADHVAKNPFPKAIARDEFNELIQELSGVRSALTEKLNEIKEKEGIIEDLKLAKDATQVKEVMKAHQPNDPLSLFRELIAELKGRFDKLDGVVCAVILCNYYRKPFERYWEAYQAEIDDAVRQEWLTDEGEVNDDNPTIKAIHKGLKALGDFVEQASDAFINAYEEDLGLDFAEPKTPAFWKTHYHVIVPKT